MSFYRNKRKSKDEDDFINDDEAEDESSSDEEGNAKKKTSKKSRKGEGKESAARNDVKNEEKIDPSTGITACMISKNRKVVVRSFKNITLIDIREYYGKDSEDLKPSKKGISLSVDQWKVLSENVSKVNEAIKEMS